MFGEKVRSVKRGEVVVAYSKLLTLLFSNSWKRIIMNASLVSAFSSKFGTC